MEMLRIHCLIIWGVGDFVCATQRVKAHGIVLSNYLWESTELHWKVFFGANSRGRDLKPGHTKSKVSARGHEKKDERKMGSRQSWTGIKIFFSKNNTTLFLFLRCLMPSSAASEMFSTLHQSNSETRLQARHILFILQQPRLAPSCSLKAGSCQQARVPRHTHTYTHTHARACCMYICIRGAWRHIWPHTIHMALLCAHTDTQSQLSVAKGVFSQFPHDLGSVRLPMATASECAFRFVLHVRVVLRERNHHQQHLWKCYRKIRKLEICFCCW